MPNPFYVQPAGDMSAGLSGLADTVGKLGEIKRAEKEKQDAIDKFAKIKQDALDAYQSGDPEKIAEVSLLHPEIAQALHNVTKFKSERTADNFKETLFGVYNNPSEENVAQLIAARQALLKEQGVPPENSQTTDAALAKYKDNPEEFKAIVANELAFRYPEEWKAMKSSATNLKDRYKVVGDRLVDLESTGKPAVVIDVAKKDTPTTLLDKGIVKVGDNLVSIKDPENPKILLSANKNTPYTDAAKMNADLENGNITEEEYAAMQKELLAPQYKNKIELTKAALEGDPVAKAVLDAIRKEIAQTAGEVASASTAGKIGGLNDVVDTDAIAQAVVDGKILIGDVKNTFGVPVQTIVMEKVLNKDKNFNFVQPDAVVKSLTSSLVQQQKQRGMMGSFVSNINRQVDRISEMSEDVVARAGVRALDLPWRELNVRFKGSGNERVFEAYMKEVSAEIQKLSQGSTASVAQLPEQNRLEWEKIHDVNLSLRELKKVLAGTKEMANMRLQSTEEEIGYTLNKLGNVPEEIEKLKEQYADVLTPPAVNSQEEFDSLPSGTIYLENGKKYRKP